MHQKEKKTRNQKLAEQKQSQVRKDKANDQFIAQNYEKFSQEYENKLLPQIAKLQIPTHIIDNNGDIKQTLSQIEQIIK